MHSANEPRNVMAISPAYGDSKELGALGLAFYEGAEAHTASMIVHSPEKLDQNFMSASPRLPRDKAPMNVGGSVASVGQDKVSWKHKAIGAHGPYTSKVTADGRQHCGAVFNHTRACGQARAWCRPFIAAPTYSTQTIFTSSRSPRRWAIRLACTPRPSTVVLLGSMRLCHAALDALRPIGATDSLDLAASARNQFANGMRSSVSTLDGFTGRSGLVVRRARVRDDDRQVQRLQKVVGTAGDYSALLSCTFLS